MSEADIGLLELFAVYGANAMSAFTIYISFTFAYLATAYFVGASLTRFQAIAASGLYIVAVGAPALTQIAYIQIMFGTVETSPGLLDDYNFANGTFWINFMWFIQISGILISLYFMWNVRHAKTG